MKTQRRLRHSSNRSRLTKTPSDVAPLWGAEYVTHKSALVTPDHRYKLIDTHDTGGRELYDLAEDPKEQRNLVEEQLELAATLEQQLVEIRAGMASAAQR